MPDRWGRTLMGLAALAGLWIIVYWAWEPRSAGARVTFDDGSPVPRPAASNQTAPSISQPAVELAPPPGPREAAAPASGSRPIAVVPPRFRDYTIRPGDTLELIAQRELGSASMKDAISRANPLKNIERLRPGRTIRIPVDPSNIQGQPVAMAQPERSPSGSSTPAPATPQPIQQPTAPQPAAPQAAAVPASLTYTVVPGDSLSKIAKDHYGSSSPVFIDLIVSTNRLPDADSLRVGQKLTLPPKPR